MDVKAKSPSAPECIEIIDSDEDCELVDPSQDVLKEGEKVINKFYRSTSIQDLDAHFEDYVSAIKKGLASFKANTQRFLLVGLYKQIDQIYSIYTYNKEKYTLIGSYYYWIMEDLLVLYCNIEFEVYANRLKLDATIPPNDVVIRICNILYKALDCNFKHIINAVLRLDERYFSMNFSRIVNALLKRVIIAEYHMSPRTMEADEFCRISLIMELWKKVRKPEQHMAMDYSVFIISKWTQEQLENHDKLMYILKEDIDQDPSRQFSILQVRIQRYFQIYGERVDESMEMSDENDCLNINDMYIYSRTKMLEQGKTNSAAFKEFLKILEPNIDNPVEEQSSPLVEPPITSDVEPITSTSDGELMCLEENSQSESDLNLNNCASLTDNDSEHKQVIEMAYDQSKTTETTETTETVLEIEAKRLWKSLRETLPTQIATTSSKMSGDKTANDDTTMHCDSPDSESLMCSKYQFVAQVPSENVSMDNVEKAEVVVKIESCSKSLLTKAEDSRNNIDVENAPDNITIQKTCIQQIKRGRDAETLDEDIARNKKEKLECLKKKPDDKQATETDEDIKDIWFFRSILPQLRQLSEHQKLQFKIKVIQLLHDPVALDDVQVHYSANTRSRIY